MLDPSRTPTPFVLIVEDHPLVADSLVACVRGCAADIETEIAESLRAALRILDLAPVPLLILTDLTLPDTQGTDAVRCLRQAAPQTPLLVFTAQDDPRLRSEAQALGVLDYLIKSSSIQVLREAIAGVIGGWHGARRNVAQRDDGLSGLLTPKQRVVLEELAAGRSNKEIAVRMNVSSETVNSHMKEILGRLAVRNRTEAVVRYLQLSGQPGDDDLPR